MAIKRTLLQTEEDEEDDEEEKEVTAMIGKQRTMYGIITLYLLSVASFIHCLWNCHTTYCGKKAMSKVKVAEMSRELRGGGGMGTCVLGFGYSDYGFIFCSLMCLHFLFSPFVGWSVGRSLGISYHN